MRLQEAVADAVFGDKARQALQPLAQYEPAMAEALEVLAPVFQPFAVVTGLAMLMTALFALLYAFWGWVGVTGWQRSDLAGCGVSAIHGIGIVIGSSIEVAKVWPCHMDLPNTHVQLLLLQWSSAYFLVDSLVFLIPHTQPLDVIFLAHHVLVLLYMMLVFWTGRGAIACLMIFILGEVTSPLQNLWFTLRDLKHLSPTAKAAHAWLTPVYGIQYLLVRSLLGPVTIGWQVYDLLTACSQPSFGIRVFWSVVLLTALAGSQLWAYKLARKMLRPSPSKSKEL